MYEVEHVLALNNALGEGPLWNVDEQAIYWLDIPNSMVYKLTPKDNNLQQFKLPKIPGCLAFKQGGGLVFATSDGFALWENNEMTILKDNIAYKPASRFNDGAVDRQGRFWAGTASDDPTNHLYCLDNDGDVQIMEKGIAISNGIGWSPDNKTMYYSDSGGAGVVYAYDYDLATGAIENRRVFLPPTGTKAVADGLTVDSEGCIWSAYWDGWKVARYDPDGKLMTEIKMPVQRPTSCAFGGPDLNALYITSASVELDIKKQPLAGDLFKIVTDVKGLPEPDIQLNIIVV